MNQKTNNINNKPVGETLVTMQPVGKPKPISIDDVGSVESGAPILQYDQPIVHDNADIKDDKK